MSKDDLDPDELAIWRGNDCSVKKVVSRLAMIEDARHAGQCRRGDGRLKLRHATREAAIATMHNPEADWKIPYLCDECGSWHLGRRPYASMFDEWVKACAEVAELRRRLAMEEAE